MRYALILPAALLACGPSAQSPNGDDDGDDDGQAADAAIVDGPEADSPFAEADAFVPPSAGRRT